MNIEDVKVVRLKTGEDIIGYVTDINETKFNINYPMIIELSDIGGKLAYTMQNWISYQVFKYNEANLWSNDILFVSDPKDTFVDYYVQMVEKLEKYITASEIMEHLEEEEEIMIAMEDKEHNVIH